MACSLTVHARSIAQRLVHAPPPECQHHPKRAPPQPRGRHWELLTPAALEQPPSTPGDHWQGRGQHQHCSDWSRCGISAPRHAATAEDRAARLLEHTCTAAGWRTPVARREKHFHTEDQGFRNWVLSGKFYSIWTLHDLNVFGKMESAMINHDFDHWTPFPAFKSDTITFFNTLSLSGQHLCASSAGLTEPLVELLTQEMLTFACRRASKLREEGRAHFSLGVLRDNLGQYLKAIEAYTQFLGFAWIAFISLCINQQLINYSGNLLGNIWFFSGHLKQSKVPESLQGMQW